VSPHINATTGRRVLLVALLAGSLAACSPESERARGGGPGADPNNKDAVVEMHKGATPYYETPDEKDRIPVEGTAR
jgi:hypothetical protein